ncbi:MAG: toxin-antitoxin system YwqK family antitoxin [Crocinitomicaceae bacterium]
MKKEFIIILVLTVLFGCSETGGINDSLKRNENWCWLINKATRTGEWLNIVNSEPMSKYSGDYTMFFSNGKIRRTGKLKDGIEADTIFNYDINENIVSKIFKNIDGELEEIIPNGKYKRYFPTCELEVEGEYYNNEQIGPRIEYYKNGNIKVEYGKKVNVDWLVTYSVNGPKIDSSNTINGKLNGIAKCWYPSGQLESVQTFKNDSLTGHYSSYHGNGQIRQEGMRWRELADDTLIDWYDNGQMKAKRFYQKGLKQGGFKHWFESGKVQVSGTMLNDKKDGLYQEYYENEKLKKTGKYSSGEKIGIWEYYDEDGNLIETKTY